MGTMTLPVSISQTAPGDFQSRKSEVEDPVSGDKLGTPDQRDYRAQASH
jgi:hypothetical protein